MAAEPRVFKTISEKLGGHWHVHIFAAKSPDQTYAGIGELTMDEHDFIAFTSRFSAQHVKRESHG